MKLQISFDLIELEKAIDIAKEIQEYADIIELGTLLLYQNGIKALEDFRKEFPDKTLLVNTKIINKGKETAQLFAKAGADWITVMAGTSKKIIHSACSTAHDNDTKVMLDLHDASSFGQSALEAQSLGADALLFHNEYDEAEHLVFTDQWNMVRGNTTLPIFVAGNVNEQTFDPILSLKPDGIIIGRAIVEQDNAKEIAAQFYENMQAISEQE